MILYFSLKQLCIAVKSVITNYNVLEYKASLNFKCVCIAMYSLVMNHFSHDFLIT